MITREEVLMGRDKQFPLDKQQEDNLAKLLIALNKLRKAYGKPLIVSSGYRPAAINAQTKGAAKKSSHIMCLACDFKDIDGKIDKWCLDNLHILTECGLYLESPEHTPNWCHVQCIAPKSGARVFIP